MAATAIVLGASGGIGAALLEQLRTSGEYSEVIGFSRHSTPALDMQDPSSIESVAAHAIASGELRLIINATGFLHAAGSGPERSWRDLNPDYLAQAFAVNAIGPALLMKHLLPYLPRTGRAVFATLSARVGSIGDNRLGGWYGYRASKAALNQFVRTASIELRRRSPDAICVALHPGTVATALSAPFIREGLELQTPATAAQRLLQVIAQLTPADSGGFFDHRGTAVPW